MIEYSLEAGTGPAIPLVSHSGGVGQYLLGDQTSGLGFAEVTTKFASGAAHGARLVSARVGEQDAALHLGVWHPDRHERERLLRALAQMLRIRDDRPLPRLVATYSDGEILERAFVFTGGASEIVDGTSDTSEILLEIINPHPYWRSRRPIEIRAEVLPGAPLLPQFDLSQVIQTSASAEQYVENSGMVPVPIQWRLTGPSSGPTTVLVNGRGWQFTKALAAGEVVTVSVSTDGVEVTDQTGADRFTDLAVGAEFPWLPEGTHKVSMEMVGATVGASRVSGFAYPEWEVVHG